MVLRTREWETGTIKGTDETKVMYVRYGKVAGWVRYYRYLVGLRLGRLEGLRLFRLGDTARFGALGEPVKDTPRTPGTRGLALQRRL